MVNKNRDSDDSRKSDGEKVNCFLSPTITIRVETGLKNHNVVDYYG